MKGGHGMMGMKQGGGGGMMGGGGSPAMQAHFRQIMGRLDLLDARLAKMETLLEHLTEQR
jgi:hypothetical protein